MSRFGNFCERFIEAGWLAVLGLIPLYINFFTSRGWSVEKAYLLRIIVFLMAAAWLMKLWEGGMDRGFRHALAPLWKNPLAAPVLAYVLVLLASTAASVSPSLSFSGSYLRLQGTFTTLVYVTLFCLIVLNLRTRQQFDRIISVLLLSSIPICLYAFAQELGWDPIRTTGPEMTLRWPIRSTLGNHIFLGGYLIMLMPWTAARLIGALERRRQGLSNQASSSGAALLGGVSILVQNLFLVAFLVYTSSSTNQQLGWITLPVLAGYLFLIVWTSRLQDKVPPLAMAVAYSVVLVLQSVALAFTLARGPWIAALGAAMVFGLLIALRRRMRRLMAGMAACAVLVGLFLIVLNVPRGPLQPLKRYALFKRLGSLSAAERDPSTYGSIVYRLLLWQTVGRLVSSWPNIGPSQDPLARVRPLIGYGPETMGLTIEKVLAPRLGPGENWRYVQDRAHNDFLDQLAETGFLGLAAFLFVLVIFYRIILKALSQSQDAVHELSLIALIAATTAHLIEIQSGFAITATRMLLWIFLALGAFLIRAPLAQATGEADESQYRWKSWMFPYLLLTLLLVIAQITTVKSEGIQTGLFVGMGWMIFAMLFLALDFGSPSGAQTARWGNWWMHALTVGVAGLLIYHGSIRPSVAAAYFASGRSTNPRESLVAYQKAATIDPREDAYSAELGRYLMQLGLAVWDQAPDVKPPDGFEPSVLLARTLDGRFLIQLGGEGILALAEASIQEARRLQPMDARHAFDLAELNHSWGLRGRQERLDTSLRYYRETAELSPNRLIVLLSWANAYLDNNQPTQALRIIQTAQSMGHDSWLIHFTLALIHNKAGDRDLALKEAKATVRLSQGKSEWWKPKQAIPNDLILKLEEELKLPSGSLN